MSYNFIYGSRVVFSVPRSMQFIEGNFSDTSMAGAILDNKVQVTKISDTKDLLTMFGKNPTENPTRVLN
jgi:hypothetical protein